MMVVFFAPYPNPNYFECQYIKEVFTLLMYLMLAQQFLCSWHFLLPLAVLCQYFLQRCAIHSVVSDLKASPGRRLL